MTRSSTAHRVVAWLLVGALLGVGIVGTVAREPLAVAAGLARDGAPTSVPSGLFASDPTPGPQPGDDGLAALAAAPDTGELPDREVLDARIAGLDTTLLEGVDGAPVLYSWEALDVDTGAVVASGGTADPLIPASNTKMLTAVATMNVFSGEERFATTIVQPASGSIVLVGGGDPMLLSEPADPDAYPAPPSTRELAEAAAEALKDAGQTVVTLGYDATLFADDGWNRTWPATYRDQVTQLSALWVDEGRTAGGRSRTPAADAAAIFAAQLEDEGITVDGDPAPATASGPELARVESLPVHVLVETALTRSNNSFTETLGLQLALATGHPSTFEGSVAAIEEQLTDLGLWADGTRLLDASGLSRSNRVTAHTLAQVNLDLQKDPRLDVILDGLPTAGVTGTLALRFSDDVSRPARGLAQAKTGTLTMVATLSGTTHTIGGRQIAFAAMINGATNGWAAKVWTDQVAGVITGCGC